MDTLISGHAGSSCRPRPMSEPWGLDDAVDSRVHSDDDVQLDVEAQWTAGLASMHGVGETAKQRVCIAVSTSIPLVLLVCTSRS